MAAIKKLAKLVSGMKPELQPGNYYFCSMKEDLRNLDAAAKMVFRESEGVTYVLPKKPRLQESNGPWRLITLRVHSSLDAVGFLAVITRELAKEAISVNAVSAFYHDHLFVPANKANAAIKALKRLSREA